LQQIFELVRLEDASHIIRVLLNGIPVKVVDKCNFWQDEEFIPIGHGSNNMLLPEDFFDIVKRLEEAGEYSPDSLQADDASSERDVSNWTG
jgi:hypothetical protein